MQIPQFQNPPMEYRTRNYWGWLENITPEETLWQIDRMYEAGLGGYVMHARGGLTIPYAGKQWMDSVRAMIKRGRELGMLTIIDDEHGWPSGFGAGKVNGRGEAYQLKYLLWEEKPASEIRPDACTLGLWTKDYQSVEQIADVPPTEVLIRVYKVVDPYYVDNMDARVVDAFIEASYEDYARNLNGDLSGVHAIFSDEPQTARYATPWSDILPELYEKRFRQPLLPQLYKLFYPAPDAARFRVELYGIMQECFTENYAGKLRAWCESRGTSFTGHTCLEEDLVGQLRCSISTMPFYEEMTVPGIDWLCRVPVHNLAILQLTSAAQQMGKKRVLCEMFGCAGWNISMEEMKWIAGWQAALGINDHLQHLGLYSLRGSRKREYPASLHYQQPWYDKYRPYNDYFARVSQLTSESRLETDLLVIHPIRSVWAQYDGRSDSCNDIQNTLTGLLNDLLSLHLSPHLGDETLLEKYGHTEGNELVLGQCRYHTVLMPDLRTISRSTYTLLRQFAENGGRLVCAGRMPSMLDGEPCRIELSCESVGLNKASLAKAFPAPIPLIGGDMVYLTRWNRNGQPFLYLTNNDFHHPADCRLEVSGSWYEYDPESNLLAEAPTDLAHIHLDGGQARILFSGKNLPVPAPESPFPRSGKIAGPWEITEVTGNALTLDHCELSFDGTVWEPEAYILDIQKRLLTEGKNRDVFLRFHFDSQMESDLELLVENPEKCTITVNGQRISNQPVGWHIDKCLEALPIHCRPGENEIALQRTFANSERVYFVKNNPVHEAEANRVTVETELEAVYLWGDFAVSGTAAPVPSPRNTLSIPGCFRIAPRPSSANIEELIPEGFPFFAGTVSLETSFEIPEARRAKLRFRRPNAIVTSVSINGRTVRDFRWAPYEADITGFLKEGKNTLCVALTNSCRNLFGPFYSAEGESYSVGPFSFGKNVPDKQFVRFGLPGGIEILWDPV